MPNQPGTLEQIGLELANVMSGLLRRLSNDELLETLAQFGIVFPPSLLEQTAVMQTRDDLLSAAGGLPDTVEKLLTAAEAEDVEKIVEHGVTLLTDSIDLIRSFSDLVTAIDAIRSAYPEISNDQFNDFSSDFPRRLLDLLIVDQLDGIPAIGGTLTFFGLIDRANPYAGIDPSLLEYETVTIRYDRIGSLLSNPEEHFKTLYGWGEPDFDGSKLLPALHDLLVRIGLPAHYHPATDDTPPLLEAYTVDVFPDETLTPPGLGFNVLVPFGGSIDQTVPLPHPAWAVQFKANGKFAADFTGTWSPPVQFTLDANGLTFEGGAEINLIGGGTRPIVLLGKAEASRMEVGTIRFGGGFNFTWDSTTGKANTEPFVQGALEEGRILVDVSEGDGFITQILSGIKIDSNFDVGFLWSLTGGIQFQGSSTIEIMLPAHVDLGPLTIQEIYLVGGLDDATIPIELSASLSVNLGPLAASVTRMGLLTTIDLKGSGGNAGPADIDFAFKPPNGVGLSVDAGVVKGGGYLYFDFDREEYAGALELVFSEWIALKAIGLITTRMPDGSKGFSLLIIITVEFGSGFQLGFGFTLNGVGGILGLNRIVQVDPLKEGVRTGSIESVMFPEDVVANAPRIISDLRKFFPPQQDIFLVGPMAKLGWGTPTLVSAQLGVILEFPSVNITILGVIKVVLPDEDADVLRLQVNFMGRIEPSNKLLWFYAELYDSRVLFITLEGGFGLLVNWGDNANFVVSVGGFHPRYNPPPLPFPEPPRIAVNILNESYAKVRIEAYFAVTSNSVQFGAKAELYFGVSAFNIDGHLAFDALFQFDPFFFSFGLSVSLSVKVFGIGLFSVGFSGLLEGPTPWFIKGKGKISLLFFKISVPFEHTWGQEQNTSLDPIEVFPLLEAEFNALTNWVAEVPQHSNLLVSLRKLGDADTDQLVLHPVGSLRISQRKVPVNFKLDKVGNQRPSDVNRLKVDASLPGGGSLSVSTLEEKFAIGQFKDLEGSAQMSSPGFEPLDSGVEIGIAGEQMKTSRGVRRVIRYETIIIDNNFKRHVKSFFNFFVAGYSVLNGFLFNHFLKGNAAGKSALSKQQKKRIQPFDEVIQIVPNQYSVAFNMNNKPLGAEAVTFTSQAKAMEYMEEQIQQDGSLSKQLHVIPNSELNLAA
ncbi:conserved hypothetical protein [Nitrospina gracilis 3/211]|uniref:DUF6603 domain-containing protein n=1 Tax=Nitrospina gracilis (strain 3/211) TaxID=1266370 RepID=M1YZC5_NITG3|nr:MULTISPECIES: DUF6603 domain-containing protein [Nitrospina]MCF8723745.1 hypothetical protein [Nitrospina sp. Nb-3]CCQ90845.1 conserved hypothetical protein [Nitrospina gracilis 3/211]